MIHKKIVVQLILLILMLMVLISVGCKKSNSFSKFDDAISDTSYTNDLVTVKDSLKEGFKLTEYDTPPVPIQNNMPEYPPKFRSSGIQGVVVLEVEVLANGNVGEVKVMKSLLSIEGGLDDTAISAVKSWIFKPALLNKKPVDSRVTIPIPFSLKSNNQ